MADFHTYRVLVVDDNPLNLKLIEKALSKEGYEIFCADSGPRARQITLDILPDLILLDIDMPGEDGFAVLEKLKGNHLTTPIPVIFLTGITGLDAKIKGFDLGAVDYITKPFHPREVLARVRIHLRLSIATNLLIRDQARKLRQVTHAQEALLPNPSADPQARYNVFYQSRHEAGGISTISWISPTISGDILWPTPPATTLKPPISPHRLRPFWPRTAPRSTPPWKASR